MNTANTVDISSFALPGEKAGSHVLHLLVRGMHCAACAWRIESTLKAEPDVDARVNVSTQRLNLSWDGDISRANELIQKVTALGYQFIPFDIHSLEQQEKNQDKFLMRCLAVAGFASGNIMIFSFALWFSSGESMGMATRTFMHWVTAIIAIPTIIYSGQPFFQSAWAALKKGRTNMDVPISLAVVLAAFVSLFEMSHQGEYVYFDASVMLLFFLLIGRVLDRKARGRARAAAQDLLTLLQGTATIRDGAGTKTIPQRDLLPGMQLIVAAGEKIAADGVVQSGTSDVDTSLITGETMPSRASVGAKLFAGTTNISAPLEVTVSAASEDSLLADIVRMMENAEQGHAKYVRLADKIAGWYTPVVHILALAAFLGWLAMGMHWQPALLIATTVLIITCPCALGLAVPVVQVLASGRLLRQGILMKSADALERLDNIDTVVFDKTGTLTLGKPQLVNANEIPELAFKIAASMAASSKHPLSRAVHAAWGKDVVPLTVEEKPGYGLQTSIDGKQIRLGRRDWCGDVNAPTDEQLELWFNREGDAPIRFVFADTLRADAIETIAALKQRGLKLFLFSGDREPVVKAIAATLGIDNWTAKMTPVDKVNRIHALAESGGKVLMVGDGLNDAPALSSAQVSMSPASAMDITQNAADIVFQGERLVPVLESIFVAHKSNQLVWQNFVISFVYNVVAVPAAVLGYATPLIAAIAMSSSSILVVVNALRLNRMRRG